jgi:serine phosphatase RsbU (regulator of sigma subunit)
VRDGRGPALGVLDEVGYAEARLQLAGDDRLLLFSDGLVELRGGDLAERLAALRTAVTAGPADPAQLLDAVLAAMNPTGDDDVTLVGIART